MAAGILISKTMAVATAVLTVSALGGIITMAVIYQMEISENPPTKPTIAPTEKPIPTGPPPTLRLPKNMVPKDYKIFIRPFFHLTLDNTTTQDFGFWGNSTVTFQCVNETRSVFLHSKDLRVSVARLSLGKNTDLAVKIHVNESTVEETDFLEVRLEDEDVKFEANETYSLFLEFEGTMHDDLTGLYKSEYYVEGGNETRYLAATQMEATDARKVFPCFDEPEMKATFQITLIHRPGTRALSNWPQDASSGNTIQIGNETWTVTAFNPTKRMSTYLVAFTITDFESKSDPRYETRTKIWARPEAIDAGHADYALGLTHKIMEFYQTEFKIDYPVGKLDQIALPDLAGAAMENWGLVTYRESALLFVEGVSSSSDKEHIASVIAHELAHQWFGNLVTMKWWNEIWLNEGVASYMGYRGVNHAEPTWGMWDLFYVHEMQNAFQVDALLSSHPLTSPEDEVQTLSDINSRFSYISYSKGASVLKMLADQIGEKPFNEGIKEYLNALQYQNANEEDLWTYLHDGSLDVAKFMTSWTNQAGFPVVHVNTLTGSVSQERFLLNRTSSPEALWHIPLRTMKHDGKIILEDIILIDSSVQRDEIITGNWILVNVNCKGYYRVNYNVENWDLLLEQLEKDHTKIPPLSRGQLIDDAFNLARAEYMDVTLALDTTTYLINETEYIPWTTALSNLDYTIQMFDRSEVYGPIQAYLQKQLEPLYTHFENVTNVTAPVPENLMQQYTHRDAVSMACQVGLKDCVKMAVDSFTKFKDFQLGLTNETYVIHPNLKPTIFCYAIAAGGAEEWEFAWKMYLTTSIAAEKDFLLYSLSCTKEIWLLNRYLQATLNPTEIRKMDVVETIKHIARNVAGQALAWDFVRAHWKELSGEYGEEMMFLGDLISGVTQRFSTEYELQQLKQFQSEYEEASLESAASAVEQAIERTEANMKWVQKNKETMLEWFKNH